MKQVAAFMLAGTLSIGTIGTSTVVFAEGSTNTTSLTAVSQKESTSLSGLVSGLTKNMHSMDFSGILSALGYNNQTYSFELDALLKTLGITRDELDKVIDQAEAIALQEARVEAGEVKAFAGEIRKEIGEGTIKLDKLYGMLSNEGRLVLSELILSI